MHGEDISSGRGTDVPAFNTPLVRPAAVFLLSWWFTQLPTLPSCAADLRPFSPACVQTHWQPLFQHLQSDPTSHLVCLAHCVELPLLLPTLSAACQSKIGNVHLQAPPKKKTTKAGKP